jgi:hypothetical protein
LSYAAHQTQDKIPLYSDDNELKDWMTPKRSERLEALAVVRVVRHKKGHVNRRVLLWRSDDPRPTTLSVYLGPPYSFRERFDSGGKVWALRKLRENADPPAIFADRDRIVGTCLDRLWLRLRLLGFRWLNTG